MLMSRCGRAPGYSRFCAVGFACKAGFRMQGCSAVPRRAPSTSSSDFARLGWLDWAAQTFQGSIMDAKTLCFSMLFVTLMRF